MSLVLRKFAAAVIVVAATGFPLASCGETTSTSQIATVVDPARAAKRDAIRAAADDPSYSPEVRDCLADRAVASSRIDMATIDLLTDPATDTEDISESNRPGFFEVIDNCLDVKVMAGLTVIGVFNQLGNGLKLPDKELVCATDKVVALFPTASAFLTTVSSSDKAASDATGRSLWHALGSCMSESSAQKMLEGLLVQQGLSATLAQCAARGVSSEFGVQRLVDVLALGSGSSPEQEELSKASERAGRNCS